MSCHYCQATEGCCSAHCQVETQQIAVQLDVVNPDVQNDFLQQSWVLPEVDRASAVNALRGVISPVSRDVYLIRDTAISSIRFSLSLSPVANNSIPQQTRINTGMNDRKGMMTQIGQISPALSHSCSVTMFEMTVTRERGPFLDACRHALPVGREPRMYIKLDCLCTSFLVDAKWCPF